MDSWPAANGNRHFDEQLTWSGTPGRGLRLRSSDALMTSAYATFTTFRAR
jgi:hypothetical protein